MRRVAGVVIGVAILVAGFGSIYVYDKVMALDTEQVTKDVSVIYGFGGNVGVLGTEHGVVIVDTMTFVAQGRRIRDLAERIGGGPTQAVINTHYHIDHTHGNPAFAAGLSGRTLWWQFMQVSLGGMAAMAAVSTLVWQ